MRCVASLTSSQIIYLYSILGNHVVIDLDKMANLFLGFIRFCVNPNKNKILQCFCELKEND